MPNIRDKRKQDDNEVSARRYLDNSSKSGGAGKLLSLKGFESFDITEKGTVEGDVIPFIAGYICEVHNHADKGKRHWVLEFYVHRRIGPSKENIVCPLKTAKDPCPICEEHERLVNTTKEIEWKSSEAQALRPQRMTALLWRPKGERKAKLWELSRSKFVEKVESELEQMSEDDARKYEFFPSPTKGYLIQARFVKDDFDGNAFFTADRITFVKRFKPVDDKVLKQCEVCLDDALPILDYKKIARIFFGESAMAKSGKEQQRRRDKSREDKDADDDEDDEDEDDDQDSDLEDDEDDEEEEEDDDEPKSKKGNKKDSKKSSKKKNDDDEDDDDDSEDDEDDDEDDDEEEDNEDDEDEDDEDEDDEPKKGSKKKSSKKKSKDEDDEDSDDGDDEDEDDEPEYTKGDFVTYKKLKCKVLKVTDDGLTLKDSKDKVHKEVDADKVKPYVMTAKDKDLDEGDTVEYLAKKCEIVKVSPDGTSLTLKSSKGKVHKAVGVADVEKVEDADDDDDEDNDD